MTRPSALFVLRLAALVALLVSAALFVDYEHALPTFCSLNSGCDVVRRSAFGKPLGIPVPVLGMLSFVALLALSLVKSRWGLRVTGALAAVGALCAVALFGIQALVLHAFCSLCVTVDLSSLAAGVAGVMLLRSHDDVEERWAPISWIALMLAAIGLPITYAQAKPPAPVPDVIAATWVPGKIGVVEMSDFECPFCRAAHPALDKARRDAGARISFTRITMPLPRHPHARDASRAYLCAEKQGKADAMADKLFAAEDLTPAGCEAQAKSLGLDMTAYAACLADPKTEQAIEDGIKKVLSTDFQGLPTVWIGDKRVLGAKDEGEYASAIAAAAKGPDSPLGRVWPLAMVVVVAAGLFTRGLRARPS